MHTGVGLPHQLILDLNVLVRFLLEVVELRPCISAASAHGVVSALFWKLQVLFLAHRLRAGLGVSSLVDSPVVTNQLDVLLHQPLVVVSKVYFSVVFDVARVQS